MASKRLGLEAAVVARMYRDGHTLHQIAGALDCSVTAVHGLMVASGIERRATGPRPAPTVPPAPEVQDMIRRYLAGQTIEAIAAELGLSKGMVQYKLRRHGTPMRPPGGRRRS
jgi:DNA-directed RNA polymerase specialized sigma24 family protein